MRRMKSTSLLFWIGAGSLLVACGGQVASSTSNGSGANGHGANGNGANGNGAEGDPGPPVPSGGGPSSWVPPSGPTPIGFFVDGIACVNLVVQQDAQGAPCGRTWSLNVQADCGALGPVTLDLQGGDGVFPQVCHTVPEIWCSDPSSGATSIGLIVGSDRASFSASGASAGCSVASGPTADDASIPISLRGEAQNSAGATHAFSYNSENVGADADAGF